MTEPGTVNRKAFYFGFLPAVFLCFIAVFIIERSVLGQTSGVFSYPVDDVYIHMELAKNLAYHATWGVNPGEFGSASSSPFYTIALAFFIQDLFKSSLPAFYC